MRIISKSHHLFRNLLLGVALLLTCDSGRACIAQEILQGSSEVNGNAPATQGAATATQDSANDPATPNGKTQNGLPPLISADELAELMVSRTENLKILEPGADLNVFLQGHLPTAQFLHWVEDMTDPAERAKYNIPSDKKFSQVMSRLGIKNSDRVVIYDRFSSRLSTRLFWTFKTLGHDQVQVLDGGFTAGKSRFDLWNQTITPVPSQFKTKAPKDGMIADMALVQKQLTDPNGRLIDGRPEEQFTGEKSGTIYHTKQPHSRKGHIPGAKNVVWKDNFNADGTFKSVDELKTLYQDAGILPENDVITYCNEGLHAAPPWFVLTEMLDYKNVRLYDSSMAEWAESEQPMQTTMPKKGK